jgi:spoIIIJ-associated protein
MDEKIDIIQEITQKLLELLGVEAKISLEEKEGVVNVQLETNEPGILIGYHGEILAAIQLMVGMIAYRRSGEWTRILVNVGDYYQKRRQSLEKIAQAVAQKVKFSHQPHQLPPMSSSERRIVHLVLAQDPEVETVSEGEGQTRHVVIKPKS